MKERAEPAHADLERLVREARNGRERAFDRLAEALLPRVRRWATAQLGSPDDDRECLRRAEESGAL